MVQQIYPGRCEGKVAGLQLVAAMRTKLAKQLAPISLLHCQQAPPKAERCLVDCG